MNSIQDFTEDQKDNHSKWIRFCEFFINRNDLVEQYLVLWDYVDFIGCRIELEEEGVETKELLAADEAFFTHTYLNEKLRQVFLRSDAPEVACRYGRMPRVGFDLVREELAEIPV